MAEMSNYLENALINVTLRATAYTAPTTVYLALYTSDPTDADTGTEVEEYFVDGVRAPMSGIGSLITFQGLTQGVLTTAARTIQSALDIEKAAAVSAQTPMPSGYIKNTGADLPEAQVSGLLAQWKQSRLNRSTAYLTSTLSYETTGFSPKDMMYNEAQQYLATQIARAMNVPAYYISADMNNSMTYQNIIDGRKEFVAYSLQPFICAIAPLRESNNAIAFIVVSTFVVEVQRLTQSVIFMGA